MEIMRATGPILSPPPLRQGVAGSNPPPRTRVCGRATRAGVSERRGRGRDFFSRQDVDGEVEGPRRHACRYFVRAACSRRGEGVDGKCLGEEGFGGEHQAGAGKHPGGVCGTRRAGLLLDCTLCACKERQKDRAPPARRKNLFRGCCCRGVGDRASPGPRETTPGARTRPLAVLAGAGL